MKAHPAWDKECPEKKKQVAKARAVYLSRPRQFEVPGREKADEWQVVQSNKRKKRDFTEPQPGPIEPSQTRGESRMGRPWGPTNASRGCTKINSCFFLLTATQSQEQPQSSMGGVENTQESRGSESNDEES